MNKCLAIDVVQSFITQILTNRDAEKAAQYLTEDIEWFGTESAEEVHCKEEAVRMIKKEMNRIGGWYEISFENFSERKRAAKVSTVFGTMSVSHAQTNIHAQSRITATCVLEDAGYKICSLHISMPIVFDEDEFLPEMLAKGKLSQMQYELINSSLPSGFAVATAYPEFHIIFINDMFVSMLGYDSKDDLLNKIECCAWYFVHPDDLERIKIAAANRNGSFDTYEISYRALKKDGSYLWVNQRSMHILDQSGNEVILAYYTDITVQKQLEESLTQEAKKYEVLVNSIPGGVGLYRMDEKFTPIFYNDGVCRLCGLTREEYEKAVRSSALSVFYPDDVEGLKEEIRAGMEEKRPMNYTYRLMQKQGGYRWIHVCGEWLNNDDGVPVLCAVFTDVHDLKIAEQALKESEIRNEAAVKSSGINIWEYDVTTDTVTVFSNSSKLKNSPDAITNYIRATIDHGYIHPDSVEEYYEMFKKIQQGEPKVTAELWYKTNNEQGYWCEQVNYTAILDEYGKVTKYFGVGRDVTKEKNSQKQYQEELAYRMAMQNATMVSIHINLTQNTILDGKSDFLEITEKIHNSKTAQEYMETIYEGIIDKKAAEECAKLFNCDALLRAFADGKAFVEMDIPREIEGKYYWATLTCHMMRKPDSNDMVAFLYSQDITNEKVMHNIMDNIVQSDYDYLVVVDGLRNSAARFSENHIEFDYKNYSENFEEDTRRYIEQVICEEDRERILEEFTLENIIHQLDTDRTYNKYYSIYNQNGGKLTKHLRFGYIDAQYKIILMTRTDITNAVLEQERRNNDLSAALSMAEKANAAKSEFLSAMSHDIRTPMNAIIGMCTLALEDQQNANQVNESLHIIKNSSAHLLSLINDILDMSRIESGKVTLVEESFSVNDQIQLCTDRFKPLIEQAKLQFKIDSNIRHDDCIGDAVRIHRIIGNVLSNAIKFTPSGGSINCKVDEITMINKSFGLYRFEISDTGIGMTADEQKHIFEAFYRADTSLVLQTEGTGLGLSIAKSMVDYMGGTISFHSEKGVGTTFVIELPIRFAQEMEIIPEQVQLQEYDTLHFDGIHILLCEDHPINQKVAVRILEKVGFCVTLAENGQIGYELFKNSVPNTYRAILMDIQMPLMNGYEATQAIRESSHPQAKSIPIFAMTANAFTEDIQRSLESGMNGHFAKPIEPKKLYATLDRYVEQSESLNKER